MSAQQDMDEDAILVSYLEGIAEGVVTAINTRDFSKDSVHWQHVSPDFTAGLGDQRQYIVGLEQVLQVLSAMVVEQPLHYIDLQDMDTHLRKKTGHAEVFMNVKMCNPQGIIFSDVGMLEFGMTTTGWKATRYRAITGLGNLMVGSQ